MKNSWVFTLTIHCHGLCRLKTIKKCNLPLHLLNRIKHYLPIPTRKLFFNAYVLPYIDYCCTVWGNISSNLTGSMIKLQTRTARIILDKGIDTPSADMFAELNWMKCPDRVTYQKSVLMYKILDNFTHLIFKSSLPSHQMFITDH